MSCLNFQVMGLYKPISVIDAMTMRIFPCCGRIYPNVTICQLYKPKFISHSHSHSHNSSAIFLQTHKTHKFLFLQQDLVKRPWKNKKIAVVITFQFCCTSYFPDFRHSRSWVLECYGVRTELTAAAAQAQCRRGQRQAGSCFSPQEGDFEATHGFFLLPRPGRFHPGLILGRTILRLTEVKNSPPVRLRQRRILQFVKLQNPRTSLHCTILWTPELVTSRNQTVPDPDEPDTIPVTS